MRRRGIKFGFDHALRWGSTRTGRCSSRPRRFDKPLPCARIRASRLRFRRGGVWVGRLWSHA